MVERLGGGPADLVYQARGPPDLVAAEGNCVMAKRRAAAPDHGPRAGFRRLADGPPITMSTQGGG